MNIRNLPYPLLIASAIFINSCTSQKPKNSGVKKPVTTTKPSAPKATEPKDEVLKLNLPEVDREFRAAWIATVANINWPS